MTDQQSELIARLRRECEEVLDGDIEETELDDIVLAMLPSTIDVVLLMRPSRALDTTSVRTNHCSLFWKEHEQSFASTHLR